MAMALHFLPEHFKAVAVGKAVEKGVKPERSQPVVVAVQVDLLKQGASVQGGPVGLRLCGGLVGGEEQREKKERYK